MTRSQERLFDTVSIVLVGKYTALKDSYMSVIKALEHSAFRCNRKLILQVSSVCQQWSSTRLTIEAIVGRVGRFGARNARYQPSQVPRCLASHCSCEVHVIPFSRKYVDLYRGILVPGGFGTRGAEGMMLAIKWAREQQVPFLGICLGFQVAVIEWARNVCGWKCL